MSTGNGANGNGHANEQEQGLVFPCDFPLKIFGRNTKEFIDAVHTVITNHIPREEWVSSKETHSRNQNYISCTIVVCVQSREQLDSIITDINNCPDIIMAL